MTTNTMRPITEIFARITELNTEIDKLEREFREGAAALSVQEETVQRLGKQMADFRSSMVMGYDLYDKWHQSVHDFGAAAEHFNEMMLRKDSLPGMIADYKGELSSLTSDLNDLLSDVQSCILKNYNLPTG